MVIGVVPYLVSFVDDATNKRRVTLCVYSDDEKRGLYVCRSKNVQNFWRPSRIGAVIKSDCDLVLATRALVIQRWELRKLHIVRCEIAVRIHSQLAHSVGAIFVHSHDFAVAHVRDRIGRFYQFQRLSRLIIEFEITRHVQPVPDCRVFAAEPIKCEPARLLIAHAAQFVEKCDGIEEPDTVFRALILEIKIRTVTRPLNLDCPDFRVVRAAHRFGKTNQLSLFAADGPVISVAANCNDPLPGVRSIQQDMQPTFKPRAGRQRPRRIRLRRFIEQHRDETIDVVTERIDVDVIQLLPRLNTQPQLFVLVVQRVRKLVDECG